jgi:hypothetical protein
MPLPHRFRCFDCLFLFAALSWLSPHTARAEITGAARAFAEGQAAQLEGKHALAAERFELAFALQPSKEALRAAVRMQMNAENFARAATDAQVLLDGFGEDAPSAELARATLEQLAPRLARFEVSCIPACTLLVDHLVYFLEPARQHRLYLTPGRVALEAHFAGGSKASRAVTTNAGATVRLELEAPAAASPSSQSRVASSARATSTPPPGAAPPAPSATSQGLPVAVPWLTGSVALACGAVTLWAALDTKRQHDRYVEHPSEDQWNRGVARQKLTNVLLTSTAVLAATTLTLTFFVRGSDKPNLGVSPALGPTSASLALSGRF